MIVDVQAPATHTSSDSAMICDVDRFLRQHDANPISTVVNTIFPLDLYRRYGESGLYDAYLAAFDQLKCKGWGRYFERMIRCKSPTGEVIKGPTGEPINPLRTLLQKIRTQLASSQTFHHVYELGIYDYELGIYDPARDAKQLRGGQCLSYLSFKIDSQKRLMLTALYRNHHYIARALGNLIGLGHLQDFIATETGLSVGSLTCISTHAEIDDDPWKASDAEDLLNRLREQYK